MSVLGNNLAALLEIEGISQADFADSIGVSRETANRWVSGDIASIRDRNIEKIRSRYNLSVDDLRSEVNGLYAKLHGQPIPITVPGARRMVASEPAFLPLRGKVHAGDACEPDVFDDLVECPASVAAGHPNAYFLRVEGDCMSRIYPEGSLILIDPDMVPQDGSIAVVSIDGADFVMRRLRKGSRTLMLCPDSYADDYADIVVDPDEHTVEFVGTVVWYQPEKELE